MSNNRNIDTDEIAHFNQQAESWWDVEGEMRTLHDINPARVDYVTSRAAVAGLRVLDVGCGGGLLSESLARAGAHVTAIDLADDALSVARAHAAQSALAIDYQCIRAEDLAAREAGRYAVITCMEMLEHVPDPLSIIQACSTLLAPGGHLFLSTINRHPKAFALAIVGAEHVLGIVPKGTHRYEKLIRPSELAAWCRQCGLDLCDTRGMQYNPMSRSVHLNDDLSVNYLMHCRRAEQE